MKDFKVDCPNCHTIIRVPFVEKLKKKAIKEYDMMEVSAQEELFDLRFWLHSASLFELIKFWFRRIK